MGNAVLEKKTTEPLLSGDLNERFYRAVHEKPPLFYDVVQTGIVERNLRRENGFSTSDEKLPYEIVLLHSDNVDDVLLGKMMGLQDKVARYRQPHPDNAIDFKSEEEVISHYSSNGLGLGIFTARGDLIGQTMLSFKQPGTGPFAADGEESQANIDWLMVAPEYGRNQLCESLIDLAIMMAESSGMTQVRAHVRLHNERALAKFSAHGFLVAGTGQNAKDGSPVFRAFRPLDSARQPAEKASCRPITLDGLKERNSWSSFEKLLESGNVAKWDLRSKWFTVHKPVASHTANIAPMAPGLKI